MHTSTLQMASEFSRFRLLRWRAGLLSYVRVFHTNTVTVPDLRPGGSRAGGGGRPPWPDGLNAGGGGGAWVRAWLPLCSEFLLCGSMGAGSPLAPEGDCR